MEGIMREVGEAVSSILSNDCDEHVFIVLNEEFSTSYSIFDIVNNEAIYNSDELELFYDKYDFEFENVGIFIYKFKNKELKEYKVIPITSKLNIYDYVASGYVIINKLYNINPLKDKEKKELEENLKIENIFNKENNNLSKTDLKFQDVEINISSNYIISKEHVNEDFKVLEKEDFKQLLKEKFIPWFKEEDSFKDKDDDKIIEGIKIDNIEYVYQKIIDKYSPTKETDYFGEFNIQFISCSEYTEDMLEAVCMELLINKGKIVDVKCFDA